jgi:hypothetical protein
VADTCVLIVEGVLDGSTYLTLRDAIITQALDQARGVVVDVAALTVPAPSAWAVFTSARWHVSQWPDVPIVLVCRNLHIQKVLSRNAITRYVPIYRTVCSGAFRLSTTG